MQRSFDSIQRYCRLQVLERFAPQGAIGISVIAAQSELLVSIPQVGMRVCILRLNFDGALQYFDGSLVVARVTVYISEIVIQGAEITPISGVAWIQFGSALQIGKRLIQPASRVQRRTKILLYPRR